MKSEIVGEITDVERIAAGPGIRILPLLRKRYGKGRWRKLKGIASVRLLMALFALPRYIGLRHMA